MDNRGKPWSIDDDQKLMESPHLSNTYFSQSMGRTENAIKCRRSHLAAKMHQNDPATALEEYVGLMHADLAQAASLLVEWNEKRASFKAFIDTNRKRKAQEPNNDGMGRVVSRFFKEEPGAADLPSYWHDKAPEDRISDICESIRGEGGNLASVFNDPQYLPVLVQHYPGFEAYARLVQARIQ
jgi:hypothetical protein